MVSLSNHEGVAPNPPHRVLQNCLASVAVGLSSPHGEPVEPRGRGTNARHIRVCRARGPSSPHGELVEPRGRGTAPRIGGVAAGRLVAYRCWSYNISRRESAVTGNEQELRAGIVDACRRMNALGINQGTSGNISSRWSDG